MSLADKIKVNTRYTRSINVERDRGSLSTIKAYLPTSRGIRLLDDVAKTFAPTDQPRAWSLIGPYGSGKSAFALFLHELLGEVAGSVKVAAAKALANQRRGLAKPYRDQKTWCRLVLSGSAEPISGSILAAMEDAAIRFWNNKPGRNPAVLEEIRKARRRPKTTDSRVLQLIDMLQEAVEKSGGGGLLIIIDELGKFLEYEARHDTGGTFLLQELAERTLRGRKANLMLFVLLHQGFDLYTRGQGEKLKNDWAKVQGRFQSISFVETAEQTLRVVAMAFSNSLTAPQRQAVRKLTARMARAISKANALPGSLEEQDAADIFAACYPMHPISLLILPVLCQRFAQNERTLFSYLGSHEPHGFHDSMRALTKAGEWVHPGEVYDYFVQNQPAVLADPLTHRRWAEVVTAVERVEQGSVTAVASGNKHLLHLTKTIGLLNLTSASKGLRASENILSQLFPSKKLLQSTINSLLDASIVQYRKFSGEYRVWQGTDFNIDEQTQIESEKLGHFELAAVLSERGTSTPMVARRHSIKTGALRYFDITYVDARSRPLPATDSGIPRVVFFLAEGRDDELAFRRARKQSAPNVIWVLYRQGASLRAAIGNLLALEGVQQSAQELASDAVAAREIKERLWAARLAERDALNSLTGEPQISEWYWQNERLTVSDISTMQRALSRVMDQIYAHTPIILNELINRDRLSSQAAAARNKLLQNMLDHPERPALGIQKYPPERAIYRSVFEKGRLHVEAESGWTFVEPDKEDPLRIRPVWIRLDELFAASETSPVSTERLMEELAAHPIGLKRGIFPIIFLHYYLLHRHEIAFYDEGTYSPALTFEHIERLVRRPDLFAFQRFRIEGVRATLFDEYSRALFGEVRDSLNVLDIARPLTQFIFGLEEQVRKTRRLSETALRVRQAFFLSKSPEKLLFEQLPEACGFDPDSDLSGFTETIVGVLRELKGAHAAQVDHIRAAVCGVFSIPEKTALGELRTLLRGRCHGLDQYTVDVKGLRSFIRRVTTIRPDDDHEWFGGVLLFLGHKPIAKWTDQDADTAEYRLAEFSRRLLDLERLRLHHDTHAHGDKDLEVILIKTLSSIHGEIDEVVSMNKNTETAIAEARRKMEDILSQVADGDLALALVASVAHEFLTSYRRAQQSQPGRQGELREVG